MRCVDLEKVCFSSLQLDQYGSDNSEFLDRMRHASCFDHIQRVKGFMVEFLGSPRTPDNASLVVRDFVEVGVALVM